MLDFFATLYFAIGVIGQVFVAAICFVIILMVVMIKVDEWRREKKKQSERNQT